MIIIIQNLVVTNEDSIKIPVLLLQKNDIISKYTEQTLVYPMTMVQSCTMEHMILVLMVGQLSLLFNLQVLGKGKAYQQQIGDMYRELIVSATMPEHKANFLQSFNTEDSYEHY